MPEVTRERDLPEPLRETVARLRDQYTRGEVVPVPGGVRFSDGSSWFANGYEVRLDARDALADAVPAVGVFGSIGLALYTYYLFDDGHAEWPAWAACTAAFVIGTGTALYLHQGRAMRAVARMELGTLLLSDHLLILSHGRCVPFERASIVAHEQTTKGTEIKTSVHAIRYRTRDGESVQPLTGFGNAPEAVSALQRWIAGRGVC